MIDDQFVLRVERLRDEIEQLKQNLRRQYRTPSSQVSSRRLREEARRIAETWMVEVAPSTDVRATLDPEALADYGVAFQRLLTLSERRSLRRRYDGTIRSILTDFRARVVIPLKQRRGANVVTAQPRQRASAPVPLSRMKRAFIGHSFSTGDRLVVDVIVGFLRAFDIEVVTGEKPKADRISDKVQKRIERCEAFVGLFTRRDRIAGRDAWTTSTWVIEEKAVALALGKRLLLIREKGVDSIGGLQGDYEYLDFEREHLVDLLLKLIVLLRSTEE